MNFIDELREACDKAIDKKDVVIRQDIEGMPVWSSESLDDFRYMTTPQNVRWLLALINDMAIDLSETNAAQHYKDRIARGPHE